MYTKYSAHAKIRLKWPWFLGIKSFHILFSGILGYKIHFDKNGDAEFNLTLLDMQPIRK